MCKDMSYFIHGFHNYLFFMNKKRRKNKKKMRGLDIYKGKWKQNRLLNSWGMYYSNTVED